jgi:uroporphyrinogen-III decarboxylase
MEWKIYGEKETEKYILRKAFRDMLPEKIANREKLRFAMGTGMDDVMDDIVMEMGIDVINPIEPYSMDIFDIKEKYGKSLTISGNIDIAGPLAFGTPEEAKEEVRYKMERLKKGGRYILSTNRSIMDDIPPENYRAMLDAGLEYGVYN